ncbi:MafI family immunity protein [Microbispora triticiradicis]|uniref:MafI family immunity protein n=2 Tax=Microbispora TaxID=2005 RepID=A0ABY3M3T1_9ACTN|nr:MULTISPECIES: MafI family immunity protein [Microbispora]TLP62117.1 MafI family immunity protein [Microbispora fusca]TYB66225.1 MafI family immunity protein [Microbispora tritici]
MDIRSIRSAILELLDASPVNSVMVRGDIRESVAAGEVGLAFDTLCSWIYEDSLPISTSYHHKLATLADDLDMQHWIARLDELVREDSLNVGLLSLFRDELGSVRDIYVVDADLETWGRLLAALRESRWVCRLFHGQRSISLVSAATIFAGASPEADTYDLRITVGDAWIWCHFYSVNEVEFSFQAGQIASAFALEQLVEFMRWLSESLASDVKLTVEAPSGDAAPPLLLVERGSGELRAFPA